ncbi:MAG TPA: hypothetical protein VE197_10700 [Mycobacterium sp.]|nr:hypothetical protein [Mycobacterium sp.]
MRRGLTRYRCWRCVFVCLEGAHPAVDVGEQVCPLAKAVEDFPTTLLFFWVGGAQRGLELVKDSPLLIVR